MPINQSTYNSPNQITYWPSCLPDAHVTYQLTSLYSPQDLSIMLSVDQLTFYTPMLEVTAILLYSSPHDLNQPAYILHMTNQTTFIPFMPNKLNNQTFNMPMQDIFQTYLLLAHTRPRPNYHSHLTYWPTYRPDNHARPISQHNIHI
ncbi:hypothetical protein CHS0354_036230 [Potamilus streckersoni]|uniref:Uncharacterized protein n=1 Tax=Potamilus streckersoni TaxID=2493646 RepID=A0AAE0SWF9_9BIVA|nr:hypothetical protein CHS0354_036230 [Potamilus streckersoni]